MVRGLDHVVVAVKDLDAAGEAFAGLGFTVTPVNRHSWGTANRLIQLDDFFIEILSIAEPDRIPESDGDSFSFGAFNRDFLSEGEGASMLVLDSTDPQRDRAEFQKAGLRLFKPFSFERVATYADGSTAKVGFDLTFLQDPLAPGIAYFSCRNRFPENFWKPDFQSHANGACSVAAVYIVASDPSDHHEFLGGFTGQREMRATSLGLELVTARGKILVMTPYAYETLVGRQALEEIPGDLPRIAALEVACRGLAERRVVTANNLFGLTLILTPAA
jgi:hypothetical protein